MLNFTIAISDSHNNISLTDEQTGLGYEKYTNDLTAEKTAAFIVNFLKEIYSEIFNEENLEGEI